MKNKEKNKELVKAFIEEVFVRHNLDSLDKFMRDDYIQHNADCSQGKKGFVDFFVIIFNALPDFKYALKKIVADEDMVWTYSATTGTHTGGDWLGVKAGGSRLNFDVVDMFRMQDGKIAEHWDVADTHSLFSQLGRTDFTMMNK
jgi:predicted SnoaL-like aldol condensation-catalyzing enzyme